MIGVYGIAYIHSTRGTNKGTTRGQGVHDMKTTALNMKTTAICLRNFVCRPTGILQVETKRELPQNFSFRLDCTAAAGRAAGRCIQGGGYRDSMLK
jgi:hypothetical protein